MKILIVDDDDFVRALMVQTLQSAGHQTEECSDGLDAIARLGTDVFDLVVTDIIMPNEGGISVASYVREHKLPTSVLAVSGYLDDSEGSISNIASYYADDTLKKPFRKEELLDAVLGVSSSAYAERALENM